MTVGTGLFLSAIFLGLIALFIATKDRWKWKKIIFWSLGVVGLLVVSLLGLIAYENRPSPPEKLADFWELTLGMTPNEVRFRKGEPTSVRNEGPDAEWHFAYDEGYTNYFYRVGFNNGKVRYVFFLGPSYKSPSVGGVNIGNSQEELFEALGKPSAISNSNDSLRRLAHFDSYHLVVNLELNRVVGFGIYNPADGNLKFAEDGAMAGSGTYDDILQGKTYSLEEVVGDATAKTAKAKGGAASRIGESGRYVLEEEKEAGPWEGYKSHAKESGGERAWERDPVIQPAPK